MMRQILLVLIVGLVIASCGKKPAGPLKEYTLHGEVVRVDPEHHIAVINGEKVEGWMEKMTMEYPVKEQADLDKLKPGLKIQATVFQRPSDLEFWIGNVTAIP